MFKGKKQTNGCFIGISATKYDGEFTLYRKGIWFESGYGFFALVCVSLIERNDAFPLVCFGSTNPFARSRVGRMKWESARSFPRQRQIGVWVNFFLPLLALLFLTFGCRPQSHDADVDAPIVNRANSIEDSNRMAALQSNLDLALQIQRKQEPPGSTTSWTVTTNDGCYVLHMHNDASGSNWVVGGGSVPISPPYKYNDTNSGISFLVESDGRHITATGSEGKKLWRKDIVAAAPVFKPYYVASRIVYIGKFGDAQPWMRYKNGKGKFISIGFDSKQFGVVEVDSGDFIFAGQD